MPASLPHRVGSALLLSLFVSLACADPDPVLACERLQLHCARGVCSNSLTSGISPPLCVESEEAEHLGFVEPYGFALPAEPELLVPGVGAERQVPNVDAFLYLAFDGTPEHRYSFRLQPEFGLTAWVYFLNSDGSVIARNREPNGRLVMSPEVAQRYVIFVEIDGSTGATYRPVFEVLLRTASTGSTSHALPDSGAAP